MKFAILPGSARQGSLNKKLARVVQSIFLNQQHETIFFDLRQLDIPLYDGDMESKDGIPKVILDTNEKIKSCHALIIVTPEYNRSTPGVLKNVIDWLSRNSQSCFMNKSILMMSASPGPYGGAFSVNATKVSLERLGGNVYPESFSLSSADKAFTSEDKLIDIKTEEKIQSLLIKFTNYAVKLNSNI